MAKNTYGTGCFMLMHTGSRFEPSCNGLSRPPRRNRATQQYALEGACSSAARWCSGCATGYARSRNRPMSKPLRRFRLGRVFVPAFTRLGAPTGNPTRGTITLPVAQHGRARRAPAESIAFQSAALLAAMGRDAGAPITELRVDAAPARTTC